MQSTLFSLNTLTVTGSGSGSRSCQLMKPISGRGRRSYSLSCSSKEQSPEYEETCSSQSPNKEMTALQKHVAFFDRNHDGLIYPWETIQGFMAIGFNPILAFFCGYAANIPLSFSTRPWKIPDPFLPIVIKEISRGTHGSVTGVYDKEGRFDNDKFEDIFKKYAKEDPESLTHSEIMDMVDADREPCDFIAWIEAYAEWQGLYLLARNNKDKLEKETVRACYDGSLFLKIETERRKKKEEEEEKLSN